MKDSKEFILETAYTLFLKQSYKAVTIKDLMDKTNLTKGAFYHHFQSKEQIFREIIDTYFQNFTNVDFDRFSKTSLAEFIRDYVNYNQHAANHLKRLNKGNNQHSNHYSLIFEALRILPDLKEKVKHHLESEKAAWQKSIENAGASKEINNKLSAQQLAELFMNISDGTAIQLFMLNDIYNINNTVAKKWQDLYNLIKA